MAYFSSIYYGSGVYYAGTGSSSADQLIGLNFYRTDIDDQYVFHWTFKQEFMSLLLDNFDYQLQLDTDPAFSAPITHETISEIPSIIVGGRSISDAFAATNIGAGLTLDINIDGDGIQTVVLALNVTGATIAADIQAKVNALIAVNPVKQPAFVGFTVTFNGIINQYTLISGGTGTGSTVVVSGGTAASQLKLGLAENGSEIRGNSAVLQQAVQRVLIVENSSEVLFDDVTATTNTPGLNQYVTNFLLNQITFNTANLPDTIKIIYVPSTGGDIVQFQRGCVAKGFTVPVYDRIESDRVTFYARIRIKNGLSFGPYSSTLTVRTIEDVVRETADRHLGALPDRHVYPVDEAFKPLTDRKSNISVVYGAYGTEFDRIYLEKEHTIREPRQERTRDERLFSVMGSRFSYPKPSAMEFVDYRLILSALKEGSLVSGSYGAVKRLGRAFTGVDPQITPLSSIINFITANETYAIEFISVSLAAAAILSEAVRTDPIIPGSLTSGPVTTVMEVTSVPVVPGPYTVVLANKPANIPTIGGFTFTNDVPSLGEFALDFSTDTLTFNAGDAGAAISVVYVPFPSVGGDTLDINIDGDGVQTLTLSAGPFVTKQEIAADIQTQIRSATAFTLANQPAYNNALVFYDQAADTFTIISGNQNPSPTSSVIVTAGAAATTLKLLLVDGATQTFGLTYITPPAVPAAGEFRNDIDTGDGSALTFNILEVGNDHVVIYKKKSGVHSYTPSTTTEALVIPLVSPFTLTLLNLSVNIPSIPGFAYVSGTPALGQFAVDFSTGELTFNATDAGTAISVSYVANTPQPPTLFSRIEAGFGIKIILNNPAQCSLDLTNIKFLLKKMLPAYTKFILTVA